jgi:hypothetical protein
MTNCDYKSIIKNLLQFFFLFKIPQESKDDRSIFLSLKNCRESQSRQKDLKQVRPWPLSRKNVEKSQKLSIRIGKLKFGLSVDH